MELPPIFPNEFIAKLINEAHRIDIGFAKFFAFVDYGRDFRPTFKRENECAIIHKHFRVGNYMDRIDAGGPVPLLNN